MLKLSALLFTALLSVNKKNRGWVILNDQNVTASIIPTSKFKMRLYTTSHCLITYCTYPDRQSRQAARFHTYSTDIKVQQALIQMAGRLCFRNSWSSFKVSVSPIILPEDCPKGECIKQGEVFWKILKKYHLLKPKYAKVSQTSLFFHVQL